jgi:hypothetical protein
MLAQLAVPPRQSNQTPLSPPPFVHRARDALSVSNHHSSRANLKILNWSAPPTADTPTDALATSSDLSFAEPPPLNLRDFIKGGMRAPDVLKSEGYTARQSTMASSAFAANGQ